MDIYEDELSIVQKQKRIEKNIQSARTSTTRKHRTKHGEWKDGRRNGQGVLKTADGFIYDGMWMNNAMEGRGLAIYPSGQQYEGQFFCGRREGRGTVHFPNGAVYEGRFRDDAIDGQGTMKMTRTLIVPNDDEGSQPEEADQR